MSFTDKHSSYFTLFINGLLIIVGLLGFTTWINMLMDHAKEGYTLLVILDILFIEILVPIKGFLSLLSLWFWILLGFICTFIPYLIFRGLRN